MSMYAESLRHFLKPIAEFLDDPKVSEVMINGPEEIWIERGGNVFLTEAKFTPEGLEAAARNMAQFVGRLLSDERPRLDARLPDGSRIHVVMPPIARKGCTIAIRKFFPDKLTVENLVGFGSMSPAMAEFINACVQLKENIIVSGGTGSGKTTLLNCVAAYINDDERILTIEDSAELQLNQEHLVPFESRPPDKFGKGEVNMGHLLHSALRLRPDRIVVGEVRGGEAFHLMQAMNTGHGGSLATVHANTPTDTLRRLESLCLQSGVELPMVAVRAQVASAINVVICCARLSDGSRRTTHVSEVLPLDDRGEYRTQDIFVYTQTHKDEEGKIHGYHAPTGILPTFFKRLGAYGFGHMDDSFFDPATYGEEPPPIFVSEGYKQQWAPSLKHRERGEPDPDVNPVAEEMKAAAKQAESKPKPSPPPPPAAASAASTTTEVASGDAEKTAPKQPRPRTTQVSEEPKAAELDDLAAALDSLGESEAASAEEEETTDPGLAAEAEARAARDDRRPADSVDVTLDSEDPTANVTLPNDGEADADSLDDEEAAIAAALAAEAAQSDGGEEPSIQLADDFAEEALRYDEANDQPGDRPKPTGRPRRRRGGVVGRK